MDISTEGRWTYEDEEEAGVMLAQTEKYPGLPDLEKAKKVPPLEPSVIIPCISWPLTSRLQNYKRINFCCFKSLGLWVFITAMLGN